MAICNVDSFGIASFIENNTTHTVLIGKNWQAHVKSGKPTGSYISKGFSKHAFKGYYKSKDYGVFQCQPASSTSTSNKSDLYDKLCLLGMAQFFLDSFYHRAADFKVRNLLGSFIGKVPCIDAVSQIGMEDTRSLIYNTFLASPLLDINSNTKERKFLENNNTSPNTDPLGHIIDAYIHHALLDSDMSILLVDVQGIVLGAQSVVLFDPQAHTDDMSSGYWDKGKSEIDKYLAQHRCNSVCQSLGLNKQDILGSRNEPTPGSSSLYPLQIGF
ncbi:kinase-like domain-containing protein [Collybia nuda]|uniref:Kinase-like domain-containing protein n=1 Tax=Collybia nuda TaxID=64659 RepID=A0A9P5XT85_9AGAR|nr:kinase-like domain-containing protein [Collybia nuda]